MSGKTVNDLTTLSDVPLSVLFLDIENFEDYLPLTFVFSLHHSIGSTLREKSSKFNRIVSPPF